MSLRRLHSSAQPQFGFTLYQGKLQCLFELSFTLLLPFSLRSASDQHSAAHGLRCIILLQQQAAAASAAASPPLLLSLVFIPPVVLCYLCDKCVCVYAAEAGKTPLLSQAAFTPERVDPTRRRWPMTIVRPHNLLRRVQPPTPSSSDRRYPRPSSPRRACA